MNAKILKVAMICMHSSPLGELGTRDTGGMSVYVREVARRLAQRGYAVDIFTRVQHREPMKVIPLFESVRVIHLEAGPPESLPQGGLYRHLPEFFKNLESHTKTERIRYDLVHSHYYLSGQIGCWARTRWRVPHVFTYHTLGALKRRIPVSEKEPDLRIHMEKRLAAGCDLILAGTKREKRSIVDLYGIGPHKVEVVHCGVDLEKFSPSESRETRTRLGLKEEERVVLYVGRFDPVKGVDRLLAAAARLGCEHHLQVVLVGGGGESSPEDRALHAMCSELSLGDCVTFAGRRSHDELVDYYRAADVLALPSYYESFGLVVLEALACGTPVVATRVGAVEDIVRNGVNGWVVAENTAEDLAQGLQRALNPHGVPKPAPDAVRATVEGYDWKCVGASIDAVYRKVVGKGNKENDG